LGNQQLTPIQSDFKLDKRSEEIYSTTLVEPNMGFIYVITNTINSKWYVGQTTGTLKSRMNKHRYEAKRYVRGLQNPGLRNKRGTCSKLYAAMNVHGIDNFHITILEEIENSLLNVAEEELITLYNTIADGYNLKTGGDRSHHCDETKKVISERTKIGITNSIDHYRIHEECKGLPKHCIFVKNSKFTAVAINNHPKCQRKSFSVGKYGSLENAKTALLAYLDELNKS